MTSKGFSNSQNRAITCGDGPCLVLAGPGSGKTTVITQRTKYLIEEKKVKPADILVVTFTKAAAEEMRQRFFQLMNEVKLPVQFGTFHAVFFTILKYAYHYTAENIIRDDVKYMYLREIIARIHVDYEDEQEFIGKILGEISTVKNEAVDLEHYYAVCCGTEVFQKIYKAYDEKMKKNRLLDFDDMLIYTQELLEQRPDILKGWQQRFRYILVDEVQDMNHRQMKIVQMLAGKQMHLFLVGDDDQSIYQFRGAKPDLMLDFQKQYPNVQLIHLEENYRSTKEIVQKSLNLISYNNKRFQKNIHAVQNLDEKSVFYMKGNNPFSENKSIIQKMKQLHENQQIPYENMAVLYRVNRQAGFLLEQLMEYQIPFQTREQVPVLYDHWIAKDIFTYLRLGDGSRHRRDFLQIMNRPLRYLSRDVLDQEQVDLEDWEAIYEEQPWMAKRIRQLSDDLSLIGHMAPYGAINFIRKGIEYEEFVQKFAQERGIPKEELMDILDELQQSAEGYKTLEEWENHIEKYREQVQEKYKNRAAKKTGVSILTYHGAKGLEYDVVFMPDLIEGSIPYKKAVLDSDLEEERRLFYVGMTRARKQLYLYTTENLHKKETTPSRFLKETEMERAVSQVSDKAGAASRP